MKQASIIAIKQLVELGLITPCTDEVQQKSVEYDFFSIKGISDSELRLAVYKENHSNSWTLTFQQRPDVWHAIGNFVNDHPYLEEMKDLNSCWQDSFECMKNGFETPVEWFKEVYSRFQ